MLCLSYSFLLLSWPMCQIETADSTFQWIYLTLYDVEYQFQDVVILVENLNTTYFFYIIAYIWFDFPLI